MSWYTEYIQTLSIQTLCIAATTKGRCEDLANNVEHSNEDRIRQNSIKNISE